jgi:hypothetical protein
VPLGKDCVGDHRGQYDNVSTQFYMGTLHPRTKRVPSVRLAQQTWAALIKPSTPLLATGPVISGCTVAGATLTVSFNASLLKGEHVVISRPDGSLPMSAAQENTAFYALPGNISLPADIDKNHRFSYDVFDYLGPFSDGNEFGVHGWVPLMPTASGLDNTVTLDLSDPALGGVAPSAIRYAVGGSECWRGGGDPNPPKGGVCARVCTGPFQDCALQPCLTESCPIKSSNTAGNGALQVRGQAAPRGTARESARRDSDSARIMRAHMRSQRAAHCTNMLALAHSRVPLTAAPGGALRGAHNEQQMQVPAAAGVRRVRRGRCARFRGVATDRASEWGGARGVACTAPLPPLPYAVMDHLSIRYATAAACSASGSWPL